VLASEAIEVTHRLSTAVLRTALLVLALGSDAHAQVATLGKGFVLYGGGTITSNPNEVLSGRNSIKVSNSGAGQFTKFLASDHNFIHLARNETYTITLRYRVLEVASRGFSTGLAAFVSETGSREGRVVPGRSFGGAAGTSGTFTLTARLEAYDDYFADFQMEGNGAIVVDEIQIADAAGRVVASESAEGPTIVAGPLNLQLTDAMFLPYGELAAFLRTAEASDLDGDGYPEVVYTLADTRNHSTMPIPVLVVQGKGKMRIATSDVFPAGIPTVKNSAMTVFADLNGDDLRDIIFGEAGGDPVGTGRIVVALNQGGGKYRDVSNLIPEDQSDVRSTAIVVGDVLSDGHVEILLPDEEGGTNTALLRWNGNGFDEIRNWVPQSLWARGTLYEGSGHNWMNLADFDNDGFQDLLVSGRPDLPNHRLVFGSSAGFTAANVLTLPDGPWGHKPSPQHPSPTGAEVCPVAVADFNNDGLLDIFAAERKVEGPVKEPVFSDDSFQVFINQGMRRFIDVTAPDYINLGDRYYFTLTPIDVNNDGFLDIVGLYEKILNATFKATFGTTFFLNDGTGRFQPVDGSRLLGVTTTPSNGELWNLGSFLPTLITPDRIEGIVAESVGINCGNCTGLNVYKVVGNGSIGTGPNFADSARLGVPGFNELFYLNQHPEVAAAVQRGEYRSGLDHYQIEGRARGYAIHASNGRPRR